MGRDEGDEEENAPLGRQRQEEDHRAGHNVLLSDLSRPTLAQAAHRSGAGGPLQAGGRLIDKNPPRSDIVVALWGRFACLQATFPHAPPVRRGRRGEFWPVFRLHFPICPANWH